MLHDALKQIPEKISQKPDPNFLCKSPTGHAMWKHYEGQSRARADIIRR